MQKHVNDSYDEFDKDGSDKDTSFSKFIKDKIKQYNEDSKNKMTIKKLGETLGIDYGMFRRKITKEKPIGERDCIIAICVVLQLSPGEIDAALELYDMQPLNEKKVERDKFIAGLVLNASLNKSYNLSFNLLNDYLRANGFDELAIQKHKNNNSSNKTKRKTSPYKIIDACVNSPEDNEIYLGDQYNSLSTEYDPSEIVMTGHMLLADSQGKRYLLTANSSGWLSSENFDDVQFNNLENYNSIEDTGDFKEFFVKLDSLVNLEWFRVLNVLKDTRSYRGRTSAKVINDKLCVFTEEYNYAVPELNEYFVMTRTNGEYELMVYNESSFMQYYLDSEKYRKLYDQKQVKAKEIYNSVEEIANLIEKTKKHSAEYYRLRLRFRVYNKLMKTVDDLFQNIMEEKVFINNPDQIFGNDAELEILKYYKLDKDFVYEYVKFEDGERINYYHDKDYRLKNGQVINISHADLRDAYKLGLKSFEDVLRIKSELGSIKAIIK